MENLRINSRKGATTQRLRKVDYFEDFLLIQSNLHNGSSHPFLKGVAITLLFLP